MPDIRILTPPLFGTNYIRVDSPSDNKPDRYLEDLEWFASHPGRTLNLRDDLEEFDPISIPVSERFRMPRLICLVTQIDPFTHSVMPVYRGSAFWDGELESDSAVGSVLITMQERDGVDADEFSGFVRRIKEENRAFASAYAGKVVH